MTVTHSPFLDALHCRNRGRPPIWIMRQAGRYLPEYQKIRSKYSFLKMCHTPEIAAEVTRLPIDLLGVDAAILFSDILVIPEAMGLGLRFEEGIGPIFDHPLNTPKDLKGLPQLDVKDALHYVANTIRLLLPTLDVPLIGFSGAPFTLASYMIEGQSSRDWKKTKQWMLRDPETFHQLLEHLTTAIIGYLKMQAEAGVAAVQLFDSWANVLGYPQFQEFSLRYLQKITDALSESEIPAIVFCRGSSSFYPDLAQLLVQGISLDWNCDLSQVRQQVPPSIALQGNLDPDILYAPLPVIEREVKLLLKKMKNDPGYIFNLGHGVKPDMSVEAVKCLIKTVQNGLS